jgi:Dullard-like phosphatase family protein
LLLQKKEKKEDQQKERIVTTILHFGVFVISILAISSLVFCLLVLLKLMATADPTKPWNEDKKPVLTSFPLSIAYTWLCSVIAAILPLSSPKKPAPPAKITDGQGNIKYVSNAPLPSPELPVTPPKRKTLILDLDETLIHSTIKPVSHHHITVDVVIDEVRCKFYVIKRPHVDAFLRKVAEWYDIIIFTASMRQYADPLIDQLDTKRLVKGRLFRESCLNKDGNFIKDLSLINQELSSTIIIDNSPIAYSHNKENALPIDNWMGDNPRDESLLNLLPFLSALRFTSDVRSILSLRT